MLQQAKVKEMFEFLKKKISDFTEKLKGTAQKKEPETSSDSGIEEKTGAKEKSNGESQLGESHQENIPEIEKPKIPEEESFAVGKSPHKIPGMKTEEKRGQKAKVGITERLKGAVLGKFKIREEDVGDFFDELEFALLEGDVEREAASEIVAEMKKNILGKDIPSNKNISE